MERWKLSDRGWRQSELRRVVLCLFAEIPRNITSETTWSSVYLNLLSYTRLMSNKLRSNKHVGLEER